MSCDRNKCYEQEYNGGGCEECMKDAPLFSKQIQSKFTIDDIKSIFDEIVEQLKEGEQE